MRHQEQTAFENIMEKEEIARNEQFLLFPQYLSTQSANCTPFVHIFDIIFFISCRIGRAQNWHMR